ncbi:uncharacterized protein STAUR_6560 [Stigmatella aurantiaca DW4/3-1]|nr:uncharacterized protein STAUR_6560 [Stigmatella aurantiaca DW4/3-1]
MAGVGHGGQVVAVPVFQAGSIITTGGVASSMNPMSGMAAWAPKVAKSSSSRPSLTNRTLGDAELEKLLEKLPNWEKLQKLVGRRIPKPGTPEFAALKKELEEAG